MLDKELNFFNSHKDDLIRSYANKYIVIVGEEIVGDYDSENLAFIESQKKYKVGTFLIKFCSNRKDSYTQTFHSRASFI
jgi:hypothetical protein